MKIKPIKIINQKFKIKKSKINKSKPNKIKWLLSNSKIKNLF